MCETDEQGAVRAFPRISSQNERLRPRPCRLHSTFVRPWVFRLKIGRRQGHNPATPHSSVCLPHFSFCAAASFSSSIVKIDSTIQMMAIFKAPLKVYESAAFHSAFNLSRCAHKSKQVRVQSVVFMPSPSLKARAEASLWVKVLEKNKPAIGRHHTNPAHTSWTTTCL